MTDYRLYIQEVATCARCPACKQVEVYRVTHINAEYSCKFFEGYVTKSVCEKEIDPRCPLEKVRKPIPLDQIIVGGKND